MAHKTDASVLVCGSLAFDTTIVLDDKFKLQTSTNGEAKLPWEVYHIVPDLRRDFGGCAGNLVYNLTLLTVSALPVGTVGTDFALYANWLTNHGISLERIMSIEHSYTAQTFVVQDMDDNRITAFHPGAMDFAHFNRLPPDISATLGVIAPDGFEGMRSHAKQFAEALVPYLLYPSNSLRHMDAHDIQALCDMAHCAVFTPREWEQVTRLIPVTPEQLAGRMHALVINRGREGADIYTADAVYQIPGIDRQDISDLTGADDAFCAGIVYGLINDIDWETTGRIATLMWYIKSRHHGTQKHTFTMDSFKQLFKRIFGYALLT